MEGIEVDGSSPRTRPEARPETLSPVDATQFRSLMAGFPVGVTIVTALEPSGSPTGMTCSSLCSVTIEPPTLLVCLRAEGRTSTAIARQGRFAVNMLHDGARSTAELFASALPGRFDHVRWEYEPGWCGPQLTEYAHSVAHCRLAGIQPIGTHLVMFGEVVGIWLRHRRSPLVYGLRRYTSWPKS